MTLKTWPGLMPMTVAGLHTPSSLSTHTRHPDTEDRGQVEVAMMYWLISAAISNTLITRQQPDNFHFQFLKFPLPNCPRHTTP